MQDAWADFDSADLSEAEKKLIEACKAGRPCLLGDGKHPEGETAERRIRAEVLRLLILGTTSDGPTHELGVILMGAYITGDLDLAFGTARGATGLICCRMDGDLIAVQSRFEFLNLTGTSLKSLIAQSAEIKGDVFLSGGFTVEGKVDLSGAQIGGQLACEGGKFQYPRGKAINAQTAEIKGGVFLRHGFTATGEVNLSGAQIGGQLSCTGGTFQNPNGDAINAQRMMVEAGFIFRGVTIDAGCVDLNSAHVGDLVDDLSSWPAGGCVILDGFTYDKISGSFVDSAHRLDWLARGDTWGEAFFPQPYGQLARVLREMGHDHAARDVLIARESKTANHEWARSRKALDGNFEPAWRSVKADIRRFTVFLSRIFIAYGYRPYLSLGWLCALWLIAVWIGHSAWERGVMVPNSDVILTSANWADIHKEGHPADAWAATPEGQGWEAFNRYAWGADIVIPLLEFGQSDAWTPLGRTVDGTRPLSWWARWPLGVAGWVILAFAAVGVSGRSKRD